MVAKQLAAQSVRFYFPDACSHGTAIAKMQACCPGYTRTAGTGHWEGITEPVSVYEFVMTANWVGVPVAVVQTLDEFMRTNPREQCAMAVVVDHTGRQNIISINRKDTQ